MHVPSLIERKRDGGVLSDEEIAELIAAYTRGEVVDAQMSALAMAVYFQGMDASETAALTRAMLASGETLSWGDATGRPPVVDKHSTGGIGDKVSLVLAPLLACDAVWVPMISGRGLGITGGTLDKLESISGFRCDLSTAELQAQMETVGCAITGQTGDLCPADKKLYALRDVTGTVPSQALIVASIMSKKLAEGLDALVLDVKYGSGAFMKTREEAASLGGAMAEVGTAMGVKTGFRLSPMDEPLGRSVGNALEVAEAVDTLKGEGPEDLRELVLDLAAEVSVADRSQLADWLAEGSAFEKFQQMVVAQGGDADQVERLREIHRAPFVASVKAGQSGTITGIDAGVIGRACLQLGAGRGQAGDAVDFTVGCDELKKVGDVVRVGDDLLRVHARSKAELGEAAAAIHAGISIK